MPSGNISHIIKAEIHGTVLSVPTNMIMEGVSLETDLYFLLRYTAFRSREIHSTQAL
jgi:hypothetical protein